MGLHHHPTLLHYHHRWRWESFDTVKNNPKIIKICHKTQGYLFTFQLYTNCFPPKGKSRLKTDSTFRFAWAALENVLRRRRLCHSVFRSGGVCHKGRLRVSQMSAVSRRTRALSGRVTTRNQTKLIRLGDDARHSGSPQDAICVCVSLSHKTQ